MPQSCCLIMPIMCSTLSVPTAHPTRAPQPQKARTVRPITPSQPCACAHAQCSASATRRHHGRTQASRLPHPLAQVTPLIGKWGRASKPYLAYSGFSDPTCAPSTRTPSYLWSSTLRAVGTWNTCRKRVLSAQSLGSLSPRVLFHNPWSTRHERATARWPRADLLRVQGSGLLCLPLDCLSPLAVLRTGQQ